jgi:uncharacterized Tic20 family protein
MTNYENPSDTPESTPPPAVQPVDYQAQPLNASEERTWAMLAHLSVLINLFTGILGPVAAFIIYIVFRDRSRYVAYHALQSLILQLIVWVGGGVIIGAAWTIAGVLAAVLIGFLLMPFACLLSFIPLIAPIYGIIGAVKTSQGEDFKYWLIGDWVRGTLTGMP